MPESDDAVVDGISVAKDGLYVTLAQGPRHAVKRIGFEPGATLETIPLPEGMQSADVASASPDVEGVLVSTASWTKGGQIYAYDPKTKSADEHGPRAQGQVRRCRRLRVEGSAGQEPRRRDGAAVDHPQVRAQARRLQPRRCSAATARTASAST